MFPCDYSPAVYYVDCFDWVVFAHLNSGEELAPIYINERNNVESPPAKSESIIWAAITREKKVIRNTISLENINTHQVMIKNVDKEASHMDFLFITVNNMIINCLNAANPEKELVENRVGFAPVKLHQASDEEPEFINPKWIGRKVKVYPRSTPIGTHKSPVPHYRREHQRLQRCGEGRTEIRLVKVKATDIKTSKLTDD